MIAQCLLAGGTDERAGRGDAGLQMSSAKVASLFVINVNLVIPSHSADGESPSKGITV